MEPCAGASLKKLQPWPMLFYDRIFKRIKKFLNCGNLFHVILVIISVTNKDKYGKSCGRCDKVSLYSTYPRQTLEER